MIAGAVAGAAMADEQEVLLPHGRGVDRVFEEVGVDPGFFMNTLREKQVFGGGKNEKLDPAQRHLAPGVDEVREALVERTEKITCVRAKIRQPRPTAAEVFAHLPTPEAVEIIPEPVKRDPDLYERIGEEGTF